MKKCREFLMRSNFEVGHKIEPNDPKEQFTSEAKSKFTGPEADRKLMQQAKEFSKDLRKAHFAFGSSVEPMVSYKQLYQDTAIHGATPAKLNVENLHDLKKAHFELGDSKEIPVSHYAAQHTWIQPVSGVAQNQ